MTALNEREVAVGRTVLVIREVTAVSVRLVAVDGSVNRRCDVTAENASVAAVAGSVLVRCDVTAESDRDAAAGVRVSVPLVERGSTAVVSLPSKNSLLAIKRQSKNRPYQRTRTLQ